MTVYETLSGFFRGYLHQDYDLEAANPEEAARNFVSDAGQKRGHDLCSEIDTLWDSPMTDQELKAKIDDLGSEYSLLRLPITARDWLTGLRSAAAQQLREMSNDPPRQ